MTDKHTKTELLSPAGSFDSARAAVNAGADAIYMGGPLFSARAYAESSREDMLLKSIEFCRLRRVKVFMTLNTLLKEREMRGLCEYVERYAKAGLDGVIVQDLGVMRLVKREFPGLKLHISTQAMVTGPGYAKLLTKTGADRLVLARELSLAEIRDIYDKTGTEIEVFAHGALCYSYSGGCLMSSFIGGRSGNRGRCAGTCRLPYEVYDAAGSRLNKKEEKYLLSMKDLRTVGRLREMISAGVYSFKIEGRMKSPEYTAAATRLYRKYLDMAADKKCVYDTVSAEDETVLSEVFERGGSTDGYLDGKKGRGMIVLREKPPIRVRDEAVIAELRKSFIDKDIKPAVRGRLRVRLGEEPVFSVRLADDETISAEAQGTVKASAALNRPLSRSDMAARLKKTGDTDFFMESVDIEADESCFLPVGELNALRRAALTMLKEKILS